MRVVVLGGYGVFGSRLAELLVRDGHDVVIAGRSPGKARALAEQLRCKHLALDLRADPEALFSAAPDVVIDAAGPFQAYGRDPYVIPRLCLDHDADYLDLSDDAGFTKGIGVLDDRARKSRRRLLSGVSSVPGISSAVAADLCAGLSEVLLIDTAILPGNRAPRGTSVISSIVGQLGTTSRVLRGGMWRDQPCWTDSRLVRLGPDLTRTARFIEVPDIRLFPEFFGARSVIFRAGMELDVLNTAMRFVGAVRRRWVFAVTRRRAEVFRRLANLFLPFGTDRGGMRVVVVGRSGQAVIRREWRLIAEAGDGPYIPAVAARALIRRLDRVSPGARPCLAEATRAEIESAMTDLAVSTDTEESPYPTLFRSALADRWDHLPPEVQALHSVQDVESFSGTAQVTRGNSLIARFAAWFFGFPPAAEEVPLTITKTRTETGEIWERNFGGRVFRSYLTPAPVPHRYRERFWLFNYEQDLPVEDGCMRLSAAPIRRRSLPRHGPLRDECHPQQHRDRVCVEVGRRADGARPDRGSPRADGVTTVFFVSAVSPAGGCALLATTRSCTLRRSASDATRHDQAESRREQQKRARLGDRDALRIDVRDHDVVEERVADGGVGE